VAIQTLAAVLGGTQSLHTNSKDEALALPTEDSVRVALRTQQIVAHESGVADSIDPLAGSYYVESLTNQIEEEAIRLIEKIDELGGAPQAIEKGFIQQEIMDSAYRYQREIEDKDRIIVGVNKFQIEEEAPKGLLKVDPMVGERQKEKINELKSIRDNEKVKTSLEALRKACNSNENLMPYILDAVREYATLGEVCGVMREEFGEYKQTVMI
ncbi:MAG: methylmalonyl-CoA mutase family protein, partial [Clostridiales bacterium]|nr:methylmalonyl-CoA mutase family protein [Clostridiales bacterium]